MGGKILWKSASPITCLLFKSGVFWQTGGNLGVLCFGQDISGSRKTAEFVRITCGKEKNLGCIAPNSGFYEEESNCANMSLTNRGSACSIGSIGISENTYLVWAGKDNLQYIFDKVSTIFLSKCTVMIVSETYCSL